MVSCNVVCVLRASLPPTLPRYDTPHHCLYLLSGFLYHLFIYIHIYLEIILIFYVLVFSNLPPTIGKASNLLFLVQRISSNISAVLRKCNIFVNVENSSIIYFHHHPLASNNAMQSLKLPL